MTTVVAIFFEGIALQVASATEAALTFSSEPVWASLFGAWLLREKLGLSSVVGGGIILFACVFSAFSDLKPAKVEELEQAKLEELEQDSEDGEAKP
jgi:drug/metabolite transporter (DMT)-like permease